MAGFVLYPKRRIKKFLRDGEYEKAIEMGKGLEGKFSDDHDFMFIMASAYYIVDDPRKAMPYFERALELDGSDMETLTLKTNAHLALGQKKEAIGCINQILDMQPKNDEALGLLEELS